MLTGGIGYTYALGSRQSPSNPDLDFVNNTQPFTQINLTAYPYMPNKKADGVTPGYGGAGGLIVPPPDVSMVATGFTGRRAIVDNANCGTCHVSLGVGPDFHAGQRNDATTCNWCHRPNQTSSAWSANQKDFIHAIHGADERTNHFTWHEESATDGFWKTTYPGVLNECEMCHLPGTYDFSSTATTSAYPNMLASTVGQGTYAAGSVHAPYVAEATNYGAASATTRSPAPRPTPIRPRSSPRPSSRPALLPRLGDRDRPHADQRRLVLRAAQHGVHQAAAGGVPALPRPRRRRLDLRPARVHALTDLRSCSSARQFAADDAGRCRMIACMSSRPARALAR